jgi:hypothetical protein
VLSFHAGREVWFVGGGSPTYRRPPSLWVTLLRVNRHHGFGLLLGNKKGRGLPRPFKSQLRGCYGPVQAVVVMSPPGPFLYQDFVPTWLLMQ